VSSVTQDIARPRPTFNTSLHLRDGRMLHLAPIACPYCATVQRPCDVEVRPLRIICRNCHTTLIEVRSCA
jgi:RNase P subunit RPR2